MLRSLNDCRAGFISRHALRENLALQQQNITEISERDHRGAERHVASLSDPVTEAEIRTVREDLFRIMELNMAAIRAMQSAGWSSADYAMWWPIAVAALCAPDRRGASSLFPQSVLRPIDALEKRDHPDANHNYRERLGFPGQPRVRIRRRIVQRHGRQTDEYRRSSLDDLMTAKKAHRGDRRHAARADRGAGSRPQNPSL